MRISIGVIVALILIFLWYRHDHPGAFNSSPLPTAGKSTSLIPERVNAL
jgi:hypothetical protein